MSSHFMFLIFMTVYKYAQSTLFFKNPVDFGSDTMYENTHDICQY